MQDNYHAELVAKMLLKVLFRGMAQFSTCVSAEVPTELPPHLRKTLAHTSKDELGRGTNGTIYSIDAWTVVKVIYVTNPQDRLRADFEAALYRLFGSKGIGPKLSAYHKGHLHKKECRFTLIERKIDFDAAMRQGLLNASTLDSICEQFARKMEHVLSLGYFFADVKYGNLLFSHENRKVNLFITDFDMCCAFAHKKCLLNEFNCVDMPFSMTKLEVRTASLLSCLQLALSMKLFKGISAFSTQLHELSKQTEASIQQLVAKLQGQKGHRFSLGGLLTYYYSESVLCHGPKAGINTPAGGLLRRDATLAFRKDDTVLCEKREEGKGYFLYSTRDDPIKFYSRDRGLAKAFEAVGGSSKPAAPSRDQNTLKPSTVRVAESSSQSTSSSVTLGVVVSACDDEATARVDRLHTVMRVHNHAGTHEVENPVAFKRLAQQLQYDGD